MGQEGGNGKEGEGEEGRKVIRVDFSSKPREVGEKHSNGNQSGKVIRFRIDEKRKGEERFFSFSPDEKFDYRALDNEAVDAPDENTFRLLHGFDQRAPEVGAVDSQWKQYLLDVYDNANVSDISDKNAVASFKEIVSGMLLSDMKRILNKQSAYGGYCPAFFEALEVEYDACVEAKKLFENLCAEEGVEPTNSDKETFAPMIRELQEDPLILRRLLAHGPDFAKKYPGAYKAICERQKKLLEEEESGPVEETNIVSLSDRKKSPVTSEPLPQDQLALLTLLSITLDEADEVLKKFPQSGEALTANVEQLIERRVNSLDIRDVRLQCIRFKGLLGKPATTGRDEQAREYALLRDRLKEQKPALEKEVIKGFLERQDVVAAHKRMTTYLAGLLSLSREASQTMIADVKGEKSHIPTFQLLNPSEINKLELNAQIDLIFLALVALLEERKKEL